MLALGQTPNYSPRQRRAAEEAWISFPSVHASPKWRPRQIQRSNGKAGATLGSVKREGSDVAVMEQQQLGHIIYSLLASVPSSLGCFGALHSWGQAAIVSSLSLPSPKAGCWRHEAGSA